MFSVPALLPYHNGNWNLEVTVTAAETWKYKVKQTLSSLILTSFRSFYHSNRNKTRKTGKSASRENKTGSIVPSYRTIHHEATVFNYTTGIKVEI